MKEEAEIQHLWLELTTKCNLTCNHCYTESSPILPLISSMKLDDWKRVLNDSSDKGCKSLQLIGGEPLLHPNILEIIEHANTLKFEEIEIFTNATFINKFHLELFKKYNISIATSFYSYNPITHDNITNTKNSFQKTLQGIIDILNSGIKLRVAIIQMALNYNDIELSKSFLRTLGVKNISVDRERSVGRGKYDSHEKNVLPDDVCGNCWNGRLCVTSNGDVFPCIMSRSTLVGNILQSEISDILKTGKLNDYRKTIREIFSVFNHDLTSNCGPEGGGCGPDRDCGPDHKRSFDPECGPDAAGKPCGPEHKREQENEICGPGEEAAGLTVIVDLTIREALIS